MKMLHMLVMGKLLPPLAGKRERTGPGGGECSTGFQVVRYCLVGGINTRVSVLILNALLWRDPSHDAHLLVIENSVAYAGGVVSSFFLNKYWTFRRRQRPALREGGRFLISVVLELVSSNGLLWCAALALSPLIANITVWDNAAKLLAVAANAVLSYLLMRFWVFASGTQDREQGRSARVRT